MIGACPICEHDDGGGGGRDLQPAGLMQQTLSFGEHRAGRRVARAECVLNAIEMYLDKMAVVECGLDARISLILHQLTGTRGSRGSRGREKERKTVCGVLAVVAEVWRCCCFLPKTRRSRWSLHFHIHAARRIMPYAKPGTKALINIR